jgi:hypothetical protein
MYAVQTWMPRRSAAQRNNPLEQNHPKKFFLNSCRSDEDAWQQRFSLATDVIAFIRLIYLTTDQSDVPRGR